MSTAPVGLAVNRNDDSAMAARRAIAHDERKANKLLAREVKVCMSDLFVSALTRLVFATDW